MKKVKNLIKLIDRYKLKLLVYIFVESLKFLNLRSILNFFYLKIFTYSKIGKNVRIMSNFRISPFTKIIIGDNFYLGDYSTVRTKHQKDEYRGIQIGKNVWIDSFFFAQCSDSLIIGDNVMIGENVSIRCNDHTIKDIIKQQPMIIGRIVIEDNVWIGRGVFIQGGLKTIRIGKNSIIGANSFVKKSIKPNSIVAGNPIKLIKFRKNKINDK